VTAPTPRQGGAHPLLSRQARSHPTAAPAAPAPLLNFFDDEPAAAKPTSPPAAAPAARPAAQTATTAAKAASPTAAPQSNIFDLDFKAPTPPAQKQQTSKNDIMSLFSQPAPQQQFNQSSQFGSWNGGVTSSQAPAGQATAAAVPTWGGGFGDQAAWGGQQQQQAQQQQPQQQQGWGQPQQAQQQGWGQQNSSASANPWGNDPWAQPAQQAQPAPKKDDRDPFANIWS
jgi:stromal membrane-associated protein